MSELASEDKFQSAVSFTSQSVCARACAYDEIRSRDRMSRHCTGIYGADVIVVFRVFFVSYSTISNSSFEKAKVFILFVFSSVTLYFVFVHLNTSHECALGAQVTAEHLECE